MSINKVAVIGWQNSIIIESFNAQKLSRDKFIEQQKINTTELLSKYDEYQFNYLIIQRGFPLDIEKFQNEGIDVKLQNSISTLLKVVDHLLENLNLHWRIIAEKEWRKSSLYHLHPDEWIHQFVKLGNQYRNIGIALLKNLRVVTEAELRDAFKLTEADRTGLNIAHAFFHDDEPGSSSLAVQNVLEHMYSFPENIIKIDLDSEQYLENINNVDVLFVYEDGLWSGVELVRRLNAICETPLITKPNLQLHFKYGITSDVGLSAARLFSKHKALSRLQFHPAKNHHYSFLKDGVDTCLNHLENWNDITIRNALDKEIEPYAFRSADMWIDENDRKKAISVCAEIGRQLVRPFLERKEKRKANKNEVIISEEMISKWELGACGFASTIMFASSIPKPVLPLMWLQGDVKLEDKSVYWKPLFWDSRRTGQTDT